MAEPITPEELEVIRAHELAATEGPWRAWDRGVGYHIAIGDELDCAGRPLRFLPEGMRTDIGRLEDAEFVARSRQDVPRLLAEVERLTAELGIAFGPSLYLAVQQVLNKALGTDEEDGSGAGVVGDITLVVERMQAAEAEVDRLKTELAEMESAAADWAARLAELRSKAETRLVELADIERTYRKVGNKAGAARQDAAAEIRSLFGIEWKPGGAS